VRVNSLNLINKEILKLSGLDHYDEKDFFPKEVRLNHGEVMQYEAVETG